MSKSLPVIQPYSRITYTVCNISRNGHSEMYHILHSMNTSSSSTFWGHEAKVNEAEANIVWGRGRGLEIWPRGRHGLEALTSLIITYLMNRLWSSSFVRHQCRSRFKQTLPEHVDEVHGQVAEGEHADNDNQHLSDIAPRFDHCRYARRIRHHRL